MATIPITKRGAEKLKAELHRLKTVDRPWVINAIAEARAQGDLSENAEYDAAKDRQGFIEGRIAEVEGKLSAAQIIDPTAVDAGGKVVFGATVELEDEDSGAAVTYQIVGEDEADLKLGLVNIGSPIARALIGKEEGDVAEVQAPGRHQAFRDRGRALRLMPLQRPAVFCGRPVVGRSLGTEFSGGAVAVCHAGQPGGGRPGGGQDLLAAMLGRSGAGHGAAADPAPLAW